MARLHTARSRRSHPPAATATIRLRRPSTWGQPDAVTDTTTRLYSRALIHAWDRPHPRLTQRIAWTGHDGALLIIDSTVIRLRVERRPSGAIPKPVWLWHSRTGLDRAKVRSPVVS